MAARTEALTGQVLPRHRAWLVSGAPAQSPASSTSGRWSPPGVEAKDREIERLTQQVSTNDRRIALTRGQRAKAVTEMIELGLSATKIAKTMQYDNRETAKAAGTAGRSQAAIAALDAGQLDLEQAAVVAVFDADGDDDAVEDLLNAGSRFRSVAQELVADRAERKARAEAGTPYADKGLTVLADEPFYDSPYVAAEDRGDRRRRPDHRGRRRRRSRALGGVADPE